ncbi:hypothetical protein R1flu_018047 [Riccia fluitans]|uniref:Uncharacterized protein n=1 Tax=Riccia fluitans TaxID=41844 RepID=A0ABD1ZEP7_9MARC
MRVEMSKQRGTSRCNARERTVRKVETSKALTVGARRYEADKRVTWTRAYETTWKRPSSVGAIKRERMATARSGTQLS